MHKRGITGLTSELKPIGAQLCLHTASKDLMSASASGSNRQNAAPNSSPRSPERPHGGKSRRTLIESACTACQKRKSRCDGQRPACSRCQALRTTCGYNAEEGESRWSALRRRNRTLERERDEAREVIAQMQSRPELEAQELLYHLRADAYNSNLGGLIHEVASALSPQGSQRLVNVQQQQQQRLIGQPTQISQGEQQIRQHDLTHQYLHDHQQQLQAFAQRPQPMQQQDQQGTQPSFAANPTATQLPPLRSVVEIPPGVINPPQFSLPFPATTQRNMSQASGISNGSYTSLSSSEGYRQSLSPGETPSGWKQRPQK